MSKLSKIVVAVIAAYLLLSLADGFVLVHLFFMRTGLALLLALAEALAVIGVGFLVRRMRTDVVGNFVAGYAIFGALCFLVATVHVSMMTMLPVVGVFAIVGAYSLRVIPSVARDLGDGRHDAAAAYQPPPGSLATLGMTCIIVVFITALIAAQAPPSTLDELAYHLAIPHTWVVEGRAIELPLISHSYFPLGVESAELPLLATLGALDGGIASHFLHLLAAIATTLLSWRVTNRNALMTAAIVAVPALALTAGWSLVDWPLLGVSVLLVEALRDDDDATIAAAIGAGLLTKYTFVPIAIIVVLSAWKSPSPLPLSPRGGARGRALLIGAAIGALFFIRNLILTGNPLAPFFSAAAPRVSGYREGAYLSSYIFDGSFIDESLGASLLAVCTLTSGLLGWAMLAAGVALFFLAPSARILVPFFAIAAMTGEAKLREHRWLRGIVMIAIVLQLFLIGVFLDRSEPFALMAGRMSDEEYLAKHRASYAATAWLNATLPPASRTLVIGINETYWFERPVRGGGNFDGPRLSAYLDVPSPEALVARLKHDGITHVAVISLPPTTTVERKREERETVLTPAAKRMLSVTLDHYASSVMAKGNATLFTLR